MKRLALLAAAALCCAAAGPVFAAGGITQQQKATSENFIKALMKSDYKQAYDQFSPTVRNRYPFPIFSDIQNNITKAIGTPVSSALRTTEPQPANACIYDIIYAMGVKKTTIPLQLTFAPGDGKLESFTFLKEQMQELKK
jgi:hypothetical protein